MSQAGQCPARQGAIGGSPPDVGSPATSPKDSPARAGKPGTGRPARDSHRLHADTLPEREQRPEAPPNSLIW